VPTARLTAGVQLQKSRFWCHANAARAEHKQLQATADAQLAELSTLLRAAQSGERAALADASQARAALAGSRRELGEALEQLQQV
jgi:hypothetical protein